LRRTHHTGCSARGICLPAGDECRKRRQRINQAKQPSRRLRAGQVVELRFDRSRRKQQKNRDKSGKENPLQDASVDVCFHGIRPAHAGSRAASQISSM